MNQRIKTGRLLCAVLLAVTSVGAAWAAPSLVVTGKEGNYEIRGAGFEGIGAMDITLGYDPSTLSNPRVNQGGWVAGALFVPNLKTPGVVRVGIATTNSISGSGSIMTLSFDPVWGKQAQFTSLAATLHTQTGTMISPVSSIMTQDTTASPLAANPVSQPQTTTGQPVSSLSGSSTTSTPVVTTGSSVSTGTGQSTGSTFPTSVTMGGGQVSATAPEAVTSTHPSHEPGQPDAAASESVTEPPVPAGEKQPTGDVQTSAGTSKLPLSPVRKDIVYQSVLSLFKSYTGPKTLQGLTELFSQQSSAEFRQEPGIALSDGVTKVRVTFSRTTNLSDSPNFALKGAKLASLKNDESGYYLEVLPDAGVSEASITAFAQGSAIEFPLVVAPPLGPKNVPNGKFDGASFALFLKEQGAAGDLNGDGRKDYRDEYIYTANYLVKGENK